MARARPLRRHDGQWSRSADLEAEAKRNAALARAPDASQRRATSSRPSSPKLQNEHRTIHATDSPLEPKRRILLTVDLPLYPFPSPSFFLCPWPTSMGQPLPSETLRPRWRQRCGRRLRRTQGMGNALVSPPSSSSLLVVPSAGAVERMTAERSPTCHQFRVTARIFSGQHSGAAGTRILSLGYRVFLSALTPAARWERGGREKP